ncbi:MAG: glycoside hydrolase family 25 protein [Phocaeicola sp.]|nr:glycoside hydrolase family 25 protein [Phocaeicola sp.]
MADLSHKTKSGKTRKKVSTRSKRKSKNRRRKTSREMPKGLFYVLSILFAIAFLAVFFYFFIRPYSYRWKPCYGMKAYGVCMPAGNYIHGIDLSHYQGTIHWNELAEAQKGPFPIQFMFIKATEGGDLEDNMFASNFDSAKVYGFIRGAYHFFNSKTDPLKQANFFIENVKLEEDDLPPVLDIEQKVDDEEMLRRNVKIWLNRIENYYHKKPIIYASYRYKTRYLNDSTLNSYPYWIAHYYVDSVQYQGQWKFWQHTDVGTLPGIKENVDLDVFNGTMDELLGLTH